MAAVNVYFSLHKPYNFKKFKIFDVGKGKRYFDEDSEVDLNNNYQIDKLIDSGYAPAVDSLWRILNLHPEFKFSMSISGVMLEQIEHDHPIFLNQLKRVIGTGKVELVTETSHHSLAFLYSPEEFKRQIQIHQQNLTRVFGVTPVSFRNTELIFNNQIANIVDELGFRVSMTEASNDQVEDIDSGYVHQVSQTRLKLLVENHRLSHLLEREFASGNKKVDVSEFVKELNSLDSEVVNLFFNFQTFARFYKNRNQIFKFLSQLPDQVVRGHKNYFTTPKETIQILKPIGQVDIPHHISWSEIRGDISSLTGNDMQVEALESLYELEEAVMTSGDKDLIEDWRRMQASDHFYYMCTEAFENGEIQSYLNPHESPYNAYISFMNVIEDIRYRLGLDPKIAIQIPKLGLTPELAVS